MDADMLQGEVAALELDIDEILDFDKFSDEPGDLPDIIECIEKSEKIRREYVSKTVALSKKDNNYKLDDSTGRKENLAAKLKEMRTQKKDIMKKIKDEEDKAKTAAEKKLEEETTAEKKRIEDKAKREIKVKKNNLLIRMNAIGNAQQEIMSQYKLDTKDVTDGEVERRKENMKGIATRFYDNEKTVIQTVEDINVDLILDTQIKEASEMIQTNLAKLRDQKKAFEKFVNEEIVKREMTKDKKEAASEIILEKFSGTEEGPDYYTFKTRFEKKYGNVKKTQVVDILKSYTIKSAADSVKELTEIEEIWERLKDNYGDPNVMLKRKMNDVYTIAKNTGLKRTARETKDNLINLWDKLKDVLKMAKEHGIENKLQSKHEVSDVASKLPGWCSNLWYTVYVGIKKEKSETEIWEEFLNFIENQIEIQRAKAENEYVPFQPGTKPNKGKGYYQPAGYPSHEENSECPLGCEKIHSRGKDLLECQRFLRVRSPRERLETLRSSEVKFCFQCLEPFTGFEHRNNCSDEFACKHPNHENYAFKFHVALCQTHCHEDSNVELFEEFKKKKLGAQGWTAGIKLSFFSRAAYRTERKVAGSASIEEDEDEITDEGLYLLQKIEVDGKEYNMFYDDGCGSAVTRKNATDRLETRAEQICDKPINMGGIGECVTTAEHGLFRFRIPLITGKNAVFVAPCMDQITARFPTFPLGEIEKEIKIEARNEKLDMKGWPKLHVECGGDTDIMIGQRYRRYYPVEIQRMPSGLSIFKSKFYGPNRSNGVVGGPSSVVTEIVRKIYGTDVQFNQAKNVHSYFTEQLRIYEQGYQLDLDVTRFGSCVKEEDTEEDELIEEKRIEMIDDKEVEIYITKKEKRFYEYEEAGCNLDYRCPKCRGCSACLNNEKLNAISLQAEEEQLLIDECVEVSIEKREVKASLPLMDDPKTKLGENYKCARKVYKQQVLKLNKNPEDKRDVIESEMKLQKRGHVTDYDKIPPEIKIEVEEMGWSHFIPWRAVWNSNSTTTSCRVVFDMSATTETGLSLNDLSPKGVNKINNLLVVFIRWRLGLEGMHSDITGMYPSVLLVPRYWSLQKYWWEDNLDVNAEPKVKVINRIIYGGKASSSIAISGVRKLADLIEDDYPNAAKILRDEIYVDDILPEGLETKENCYETAAKIECGLAQGGMRVRGFTFSGENPDENLSPDGESVSVAGMQWFSKDDELKLKIGDKLNFSDKHRGKKKEDEESYKIPNSLTRKHTTGKVAEIWDLSGMFTPLIARFKLDLHDLIERQLDWDDPIPSEMLPDWNENFSLMLEMNKIKFARAVIPADAVSLELETIEAGDASAKMMIIGVMKMKESSFKAEQS